MKKIYQKPESKINTIHTRVTLLTVSDPNVTVNPNGAPIDAGSVGSRRGGWLDDDDEE